MNRLGLTILTVLVLILSDLSFAKNKNIKFGKVGIEELEMKVYELDSSAPAIIIYESGFYDSGNHRFIHHKRVKILKNEGYFMANNVFSTSSKGSIRGKTFNLINGQIVTSKLEKESIYEEKLWNSKYVYKVAMPDVKVGSVIDIEVAYNGFPRHWYFQHSIPVIKSECQLSKTSFIQYRRQIGGIVTPKFVGHNHWVAENIPAFIEEPYISSSKNYRTRIEFDILETRFPGDIVRKYASSWESVDKRLDGYSSFGKAIKDKNNFLNIYAQEIMNSANNDYEKVKMAVERIKSLIKWNEHESFLISEDDLLEVVKEERGNSADINLTLIALLQKLKIEVYPLVLSTRENGMLHPVNPSFLKLNYVLAFAKIDDKFITLDATSETLPFNMLPERCLNYRGQALDKRGTQKISLLPKEKFAQKKFYELILDDNHNLTGMMSFMNIGYAAYDLRNNYKMSLSEQDFVQEVTNTHNGLLITDYTIENIDAILEKPVIEKYHVEIEDVVSIIDNQLYINMFLFEQINENPFKIEDRKYPIDFIYKRANNGVIQIKIPENYTLVELPEPVSISLPENLAKFTMIYQLNNNILTLNYKLLINQIVFGEDDYLNIKEFYNNVVSNQSKPVILNLNE